MRATSPRENDAWILACIVEGNARNAILPVQAEQWARESREFTQIFENNSFALIRVIRGPIFLYMAGYSGTPLAKKLGIKAGQSVCTIGAPSNYRKLLQPLPEKVTFTKEIKHRRDFCSRFRFKTDGPGNRIETTPKTNRGHAASSGFRGRRNLPASPPT